MSSSGTVPRRPRPVVPGGVTATRRAIRRRGGLMGIAIACGLFVVGLIFKTLFTGSLGGAVSFVFMVMALPVMPLLGMPASGGVSLLFAAVIASAVIWWVLGQVVAARVTRYPVVGWREWTREFVVIGFGLWIGAAGGLLLGALVLGAF